MKQTFKVINCLIVYGIMTESCVYNHEEFFGGVEKIEFVFEQAEKQFDFCSMVDSLYEPIVLETTDDCIIGKVSKIAFRGDSIIIGDEQTKSVFFFNDKGEYLSKIKRVGRGPQEYIDMTDLFFTDKCIYIMDNMQFKVCCYDFSGKHLTSYDTQEGVCIGAIDGKVLVSTTWGGGTLWENYFVAEFDSLGNLNNTYIKKYDVDDHRNNMNCKFFIKTHEGLDFLLPSKNIVYRYDESGLNPAYKIDFADKEMPERIAQKGIRYFIENNLYDKYTSGVRTVFEAGQYRFICANYADGTYTLVYDMNAKKNICTYYQTCDIKGFNINPLNFKEDNNLLSFHINGDVLCRLRDNVWRKKCPEGLCNKLYKASDKMEMTDNGVIVKLKMKSDNEKK